MTKEKKGLSGEALYKIFIYVVLITLAVVIIVPVAWVFLASIKQNSEFYGNPWTLPAAFYWQIFVDAWNAASMGSYMLNSAIVTALALGIGIQNFPEGAAISLPLYQEGMGKGKAFLIGAASGIVEPVFALLTVLVAGTVQLVLPWLLSFAAGAMLYVVVEELIPEANLSQGGHSGTLGVMAGFLMMMILDVALG